jgi:hypothetical protein
MKICGPLSYSEWEDKDEEIRRAVKIIARSITPVAPAEQHKPRNLVQLSLRVGADAETRISSRTGAPWTSVRAALSMGKDDTGAYRPSLWLTLKAFTRKGDDSLPYTVGDLVKGDTINARGGLMVEAYQGRLYWGVYLSQCEHRHFDGANAAQVDASIEESNLEAIPD